MRGSSIFANASRISSRRSRVESGCLYASRRPGSALGVPHAPRAAAADRFDSGSLSSCIRCGSVDSSRISARAMAARSRSHQSSPVRKRTQGAIASGERMVTAIEAASPSSAGSRAPAPRSRNDLRNCGPRAASASTARSRGGPKVALKVRRNASATLAGRLTRGDAGGELPHLRIGVGEEGKDVLRIRLARGREHRPDRGDRRVLNARRVVAAVPQQGRDVGLVRKPLDELNGLEAQLLVLGVERRDARSARPGATGSPRRSRRRGAGPPGRPRS